MRKFGLIGHPLEHSFSQEYFTNKFEKENLKDCQYNLYPIDSISDIIEILKENSDLLGLNVTIPFKQQVLRRLNSVASIPIGLEACNCIKIIDGKLFGYNTDSIGFEKSLKPLLKSNPKHALILGNGGATAAVAYVLRKLEIQYDIVSRELHGDSTMIYAEIDAAKVRENLLIVNTTPLGMFPLEDDCPQIPYEHIGAQHLCYDLIYNPAKTVFLQKAESQGATIKNGLEMLEIQAEESWKIWMA